MFFANAVPTSFLPDEDQGYLYIQMQLPEASSIQATSEAARAVEEVLKEIHGVKYTTSVDRVQCAQPDPQHLQRVFLGLAGALA